MTPLWWFVVFGVAVFFGIAAAIVVESVVHMTKKSPPPPPPEAPQSGHFHLYPDYEGRWQQPPELQHTEFKYPEEYKDA